MTRLLCIPPDGWSPLIEVPERQATGVEAGRGGEVAGCLEFLAGHLGDDVRFRPDAVGLGHGGG